MEGFLVGQAAEWSRTTTEQDVIKFAELSGDLNLIHIDKEYAKNTIFAERLIHGAFVASLISAVLGTQMPGEGTIYLSQESKFVKPAYIGDTLTVRVEITSIDERNRAILSTNVYNQREEAV